MALDNDDKKLVKNNVKENQIKKVKPTWNSVTRKLPISPERQKNLYNVTSHMVEQSEFKPKKKYKKYKKSRINPLSYKLEM